MDGVDGDIWMDGQVDEDGWMKDGWLDEDDGWMNEDDGWIDG